MAAHYLQREWSLAMNVLLKVQGYWNITKGKVKQSIARVADDQQQFMDGKRDELMGRIQRSQAHQEKSSLGMRPARKQ